MAILETVVEGFYGEPDVLTHVTDDGEKIVLGPLPVPYALGGRAADVLDRAGVDIISVEDAPPEDL